VPRIDASTVSATEYTTQGFLLEGEFRTKGLFVGVPVISRGQLAVEVRRRHED
jgi:hypothetical protein